MTNNRPLLLPAPYGKITQGTVFSCAQAARYIGCDVFALTITARCDVAQQKYPVLNYLPLVKLSDWLYRDGLDILVEQERSEQKGKLNSMLKQAQLSGTLTKSVALKQIAETHFPRGVGNKKQKNASEQFHKHLQDVNEFDEIECKDDEELFSWFARSRKKSIGELIRLSGISTNGTY